MNEDKTITWDGVLDLILKRKKMNEPTTSMPCSLVTQMQCDQGCHDGLYIPKLYLIDPSSLKYDFLGIWSQQKEK